MLSSRSLIISMWLLPVCLSNLTFQKLELLGPNVCWPSSSSARFFVSLFFCLFHPGLTWDVGVPLGSPLDHLLSSTLIFLVTKLTIFCS